MPGPARRRRPGPAELERALALAGEHLSLYQLTIERGTRFFTDHARGAFVLPDEEDAAAMFEQTQARLAAAGLPAYEISNHARPGAACRHNLIYWRYQDYVGIGPGAHGRFADGRAGQAGDAAGERAGSLAGGRRARRATARRKRSVVDRAGSGGGGVDDGTAAGRRHRPRHVRVRHRRRSRRGAGRGAGWRRWSSAGFLEIDAGRISAPRAAGRQRLNALLERLVA